MRTVNNEELSDDEQELEDSDYSDEEEEEEIDLDEMEDELDTEDILAKKESQKYVDGSKINFHNYKYSGDSRDLS